MKEAVIVAAVRTPLGAFGGSLKDVPAVDLGSLVIKSAIERANLKPEQVDEVIMGNVLGAGLGQNVARQMSVNAGIPVASPAFTINKVCGSGLKAVQLAAQAVLCGDADIVVAGGAENMSQAPYVLPSFRWGGRMGDSKVVDTMIKDGLSDAFNEYHMGITAENVAELLGDADGIIVPGGFGQRGTEGKIQAIRYARENDVPMLGVCLGMQLTCIEFARHVLGLEGANSSELDPETKYPIIDIMRDQINVEDMGGTLRLGLYPSKLKRGSKAAAAYDHQEVVQRRHRHRYEFNNAFREQFEEAGFVFSGVSPDNRLVEIVEIPENKFFVACQYHPELSSRPNRPEGLYTAFITAAVENHDSK